MPSCTRDRGSRCDTMCSSGSTPLASSRGSLWKLNFPMKLPKIVISLRSSSATGRAGRASSSWPNWRILPELCAISMASGSSGPTASTTMSAPPGISRPTIAARSSTDGSTAYFAPHARAAFRR